MLNPTNSSNTIMRFVIFPIAATAILVGVIFVTTAITGSISNTYAVVFTILGLLSIVLGVGLIMRKQWARIAVLILNWVLCIGGGVLVTLTVVLTKDMNVLKLYYICFMSGLFLWVFSRSEVKKIYSEARRI